MYTYKIVSISKTENWTHVKCNEKDSLFEIEPFVELIKYISKKWNKNEWKGNIFSVGEMRYKVKNDPIDLVYQWDDLFGIVFECKNSTNLDDVRSFIAENYDIF